MYTVLFEPYVLGWCPVSRFSAQVGPQGSLTHPYHDRPLEL